LKVTVERIPDSQVLLNIEIDPERVESSLDQAYKRLAPRARIPGFRPGKAPRALVERHYGREALLHEALDRLVPVVVQEAIEAESIDLVDRPELEIASLDPVVVKATVPVRPTVELGDYRSLRVERQPVEVDPARVQETLENLRERYATFEPVDRPIEDGDMIRADIRAVVGDREEVNREDEEITVAEEQMTGLRGLYPKLLGLTAGTTQTIEVPVPDDDDDPDLAGQTITYTVTIKDVKARTLPELDDDFAQEVGESFATLAALRERIESDLRARLETEAEQKLEEEALTKLTEQATVEFPPQIVEREIERMLIDQGVPGDDRRTFEKFLQRAGLSEEQLRVEFRPAAIERIRRSLVLSRLRELENLTVTPEEVEAELDRIGGGGPQGEQLRKIFDSESGRETIERSLLSRKTVERLRQIALGEAPELTAAAPSESASAAPAPDEASTPETDEPEPGAAPVEASAQPGEQTGGPSAGTD
jgi:trigger factor